MISDSKKEQIKAMNVEELETRILALLQQQEDLREEYAFTEKELQRRRDVDAGSNKTDD